MKDKSTENCSLTVTEGWSKTSRLFHSRVRIANDVMKLWSFPPLGCGHFCGHSCLGM